MPIPEFSLPIAVPPEGTTPTNHYQLFSGKVQVSWTPTTNLVIKIANEELLTPLYAPFKSAMQFVPKGSLLNEIVVDKDTLIFKAWPTSYLKIKSLIPSEVPTEIRLANVDVEAVRQAVQDIYTSQRNNDVTAVNNFMSGNGLLLVKAGTLIGKAGLSAEATPQREIILALYDGFSLSIHPIQFFSDVGTHLQIDKTEHPLLSQFDLEGWIEIIALDAVGKPLANEPYILHLPDTTRSGTTNSAGRIYETEIEGAWAVEISNYPAFQLQNVGE